MYRITPTPLFYPVQYAWTPPPPYKKKTAPCNWSVQTARETPLKTHGNPPLQTRGTEKPGGRFPAGVDSRYPHRSVYPGVLDFYRELDLGVNGPSEWPKGQVRKKPTDVHEQTAGGGGRGVS